MCCEWICFPYFRTAPQGSVSFVWVHSACEAAEGTVGPGRESGTGPIERHHYSSFSTQALPAGIAHSFSSWTASQTDGSQPKRYFRKWQMTFIHFITFSLFMCVRACVSYASDVNHLYFRYLSWSGSHQ